MSKYANVKLPKTEERTLVPEGSYAVRCASFIALGTHGVEFNGETNDKYLCRLDFAMADGGRIGRQMSLTLAKKSALRPFVVALLGREPTRQELGEGASVEMFINRACLIEVVHVERNGNVYANIGSVMKLPSGMTPPPALADDELIVVSLDPEQFDPDEFARLPDWSREKIALSPEYAECLAAQRKSPGKPSPSRRPVPGDTRKWEKIEKIDTRKAAEIIDDGFPANLGI